MDFSRSREFVCACFLKWCPSASLPQSGLCYDSSKGGKSDKSTQASHESSHFTALH